MDPFEDTSRRRWRGNLLAVTSAILTVLLGLLLAQLDFLQARQQQGELPAGTDCAVLAKYLACTLQGMSVQARDGASEEDLNGIVTTLMAVWPTLTQTCRQTSGAQATEHA